MNWNAIPDDPDRQRLARALVAFTPQAGWRRSTMAKASQSALSDTKAWTRIFPRIRDAVWHISLVSDASMKKVFEAAPSRTMSAVIDERLEQNGDLKPFVRRVMLFDFTHPVQALARMQRTAQFMVECLQPGRRNVSVYGLTMLNIAYTMVVFVWLFDRSKDNAVTKAFTRTAMRAIGFS